MCPYFSQGKESTGDFPGIQEQEKSNQRLLVEHLSKRYLDPHAHTGCITTLNANRQLLIKMTFSSEHSSALSTRGTSNDAT